MEMISTFTKTFHAIAVAILFLLGFFAQVFANGVIKSIVLDRATRQPLL